MIVSIIVAMDEENGIGKGGKLPWHLAADLQRFKSVTMGHYLIQGRKTYEMIGKPLPGREMVVITRSSDYKAPSCHVAPSLQEALSLARQAGEREAFIGGGGEIYLQALPMAARLYLTRVHARTGCDVFFPPFEMRDWNEVERALHPADERNEFPFTFSLLCK